MIPPAASHGTTIFGPEPYHVAALTLWRTLLVLLWCAVFACGAVLLGVYTGVLDSSSVSGLISSVPLGPGAGLLGSASLTPTPPPVTVTTAAAATASPGANETASDTCTPGQPIFVHGAAALQQVLRDMMGDPLECERVTDAGGDTEQRTTMGLVYYHAATNTVGFTNGFDHWALADRGVVHWTGDSVDPPASAEYVG